MTCPPSVVVLANTLSAARPGEKFSILAHTVSGTSPVAMIDPDDLSRKWSDEVLLHNAATAHGTQVGAAFNAGWIAWQANGFNAQKMLPVMTGKLVNGTAAATGDTVVLGAGGNESFVLHHSMAEIYDLSYTKMGFIGPHGQGIGGTFNYTTFSDIADASYEAIGAGWAAVQADKANFPEMLDYQWETIGALRGVSDGSGGWTDVTHHSAFDPDGLSRLAQIGATHMLRATGLATFDVPEITNSDWTVDHITLWHPDHDITTERNRRGGTSDFVRGFIFDGNLVTMEAQLVANAGGSGRQGIRITPVGGVEGSEVLQFGRGRLPGITVGPDVYIDSYVLDLPVMDVGQAGIAALPVTTRKTFASNLVGLPFFSRAGATSSFTDPNTIGAGVSGLTVRGDIPPDGAGTLSSAASDTYKMEILVDARARRSGVAYGVHTTTGVVFPAATFTPFVWTLDFVANKTRFWWGESSDEQFDLIGTPTTLAAGRFLSLLSMSFLGDVRFIESRQAATTTRDVTGLGAPHKRIEADANGDAVQVRALPAWPQ